MSAVDIVGGYRLLKLMSQGQTSQVWEAVEPTSGRHYAVKVLLPESLRSPQHIQMMIHEGEVGQKFSHPNVVRVIKLGPDRKNPYIVMEFFPGMNLKLRTARRVDPRTGEPLQQYLVVRENIHRIIEQIAKGLLHVHQRGYVHRDVKPHNILVNSSAEVKIIDFALTKKIQKSSWLSRIFGKKTTAAGTPSYMSPEQIQNLDITPASDIYSLGVTLYELVTGRLPFAGATPADLLRKHLYDKPASPQIVNPEVTDEFAQMIMRMLEKDPKKRFPDLAQFLSEFRTVRVFKGDKLELAQS